MVMKYLAPALALALIVPAEATADDHARQAGGSVPPGPDGRPLNLDLERGDLSGIDGEVDVVQDVHHAEALVDAAQFEYGVGAARGQGVGHAAHRIPRSAHTSARSCGQISSAET